jgi:hypothetical protein
MRTETTENLLLLAMLILGMAMGGALVGYAYRNEIHKAELDRRVCEYQMRQLQSKYSNDSILLADYQQVMQLLIEKHPDDVAKFNRIMDSINLKK